MGLLQSLGKLLGGAVQDVGRGVTAVNNIGAPHQGAPPTGGVLPSNQPQSAYWRLTFPSQSGPPVASIDAQNYRPIAGPPLSQSDVARANQLQMLQRLAGIGHVFTPQPGMPVHTIPFSAQQPNAPILPGNSGGNALGPPVTSPLRGF